jgi:hypothetical protein
MQMDQFTQECFKMTFQMGRVVKISKTVVYIQARLKTDIFTGLENISSLLNK